MNGKSNAAPVMEAPRRRRDDCGEAVISLYSYSTTLRHELQGNCAMPCDIFSEIKQRVPTVDAARYYGFSPNRAGFIACPIHGERTPSLKLYPGTGGWHCFGCQRGGSVIDFVAQVFDLDMMGAVRKLNTDFALALPLDRPPSREERAQAQHRQQVNDTYKRFEEWRERMLTRLNAAYRTGWTALQNKTPDEWSDAELLAVKWLEPIEFWADELDSADTERQMQVFRDRKGVEHLCGRILNDLPMKSKTA